MFSHLQDPQPLPRRWPAVAASVLLHMAILSTAPFWSSTLWELDAILQESVEEAIENNRENQRLVWYRIPPLPSVRNPNSSSDRKIARAEQLSENQIVVERDAARSQKQLIQQAESKVTLEKEVPSPNRVEQSAAPLAKAAPRKAPLPEISLAARPDSQPLEAPPELAPSIKPFDLAASQAVARLPKPPPKKFVPPTSGPSSPTQSSSDARPDFSQAPEIQITSQTSSQLGAQAGLEIARLPKPAPRKFQAPQSAARSTANPLDWSDAPVLAASARPMPEAGAIQLARLPKPAPKKFVAPGASGGGAAPSKSGPSAIDFGAAPAIENAGKGLPASGALSAGAIPALGRRKIDAQALAKLGGSSANSSSARAANGSAGVIEAPPELRSPQGTGSGGRSQAELAVIGLQPTPGKIPPGANLSGSFSRGKELGPPEHVGNRDPKASTVPGVSSLPSPGEVTNLRLARPEQILGAEAADGYLEVRLDLRKQWPKLSVPLSPNARMLPRRIEPFFRGRSAFAIVVPMEKMDRYTADWIVWFSPLPGESAVLAANSRMEAPLPIWKLESRRWLVTGGESGTEERVQLHIEISREGRVRIKQLLGRYSVELNQLFTNDLSRWVFEPARLEGRSIDVEAVVEVPFRIPASLAANRHLP